MEEGGGLHYLTVLTAIGMLLLLTIQAPSVRAASPTIVIDDLHSSTNTSQLQQYLIAKGFNTVLASSTPEQAGTTNTRIMASIQDAGALLMIVVLYQATSGGMNPYSDQEISQLQSWVNSGGNILVIMAPADGTCDYDIGQPSNLSVLVANSLGRIFGISVGAAFAIRPDSQGNAVQTNLTVSSSNPILNGVHSLFFASEWSNFPLECSSYAGGALSLQLSGTATDIVEAGTSSIMAISTSGKGNFVLAGFSVGDNSGSGGVVWSGADNDVFMANLFRYLAPSGTSGLTTTQSTTSAATGSTPGGMPYVSLDALVIAIAIVVAGIAIGLGLSRRKTAEKSKPPHS